MELRWDRGTKVCLNGPGHMTKMAAMHIYGKILKKFSPEPKRPMTLKFDMQYWVLKYYQHKLQVKGFNCHMVKTS